MSDHLFDLDEIPEVPLFREPRRAQSARGSLSDGRFRNDYPPEWHRCTVCRGIAPHAFVNKATVNPSYRGMNFCAIRGCAKSIADHDGWESEPPCSYCLGMGSLKARVRFEAGHHCERCRHPFIPKGDAKILGTDPSGGQWSPCDNECRHGGPVRCSNGGEWELYEGADETIAIYVQAQWRILTVHHLDGDKANCRWWNLAVLCQRCHLEIQAKVVMERVYPHPHSAWFAPHAAGYYAWCYLGEDLSCEETLARLDELLALELTPAVGDSQ